MSKPQPFPDPYTLTLNMNGTKIVAVYDLGVQEGETWHILTAPDGTEGHGRTLGEAIQDLRIRLRLAQRE